MVTIRKNIVNIVGFSLSELSFCDEPLVYRMVFKSENSEGVQYTLEKEPVNISNRLQVFHIEEGTEIVFELEGYYSYEIYQTESDNLVETGLLRVVGENFQEQKVTDSVNPQVYAG